VAESIVTLRVEARNAISSLNKTSQATKKLSTSAKGATASLTAASTAAKGLGASLAATLGPLITVGAAVATVSNAIGTFTARQRDVEILRQGLVNLGEGTLALNNLQEAANKLGNQTLFNQEEFTRGFNLLTSFRNIGVDAYERVAQAAADIAQVNQVDVSTSFMQLAKALQDPERNLSNLNRSGIAFTKTQTEVIKELMKTNKTAEAHAMILSIVEESYNKLSQAASEGLAGDLDALGETFRDFSETLGKALEPALIAGVKGLTSLIKASEDLIKSPLGKTAALFSAIALAVKGATVAFIGLKVALIAAGGAAGALAIALNAIPFVAIVTAAGLLTTAFFKLNGEKQKFNKLTQEGTEDEVTKAFEEQAKAVEELQKKFDEASGRNKKANKRRLDEAKATKKLLQDRLDILKKENKIVEENKKNINETVTAFEKMITPTDLLNQNLGQTNLFVGSIDSKTLKLSESFVNITSEADKLKEKFMEIGQAVEQGIVSNLTDAVMGTQTLAQAAVNVLNQLKRKLVEVAIQRAVSGVGNRVGGFLGGLFGGRRSGGGGSLIGNTASSFLSGVANPFARANGGTVSAGGAFVVGEKGPELLQMGSRGGNIIPNNQLGGGTTNIVNVSVDASGSAVSGNNADAQALGAAIGAAVQAQLIKEKRPGGILTR
tara:strand:- start:824 stop:2818 length:1995 start_codon:yes stop_codon:yes gene_type:complete